MEDRKKLITDFVVTESLFPLPAYNNNHQQSHVPTHTHTWKIINTPTVSYIMSTSPFGSYFKTAIAKSLNTYKAVQFLP